MFGIHFVASRDSDQPVDKVTFGAANLDDAITGARLRIRTANIAVPADPARPHPIGFLIYDASGSQLLHREYLG